MSHSIGRWRSGCVSSKPIFCRRAHGWRASLSLEPCNNARLTCRLRAAQPLSAGLAGAIAARMRTRPTLAVLPFGLGPGGGGGGAVAGPGVGDIVRHQLTGQLGRSPMLHVISALSTAGFGAAGQAGEAGR